MKKSIKKLLYIVIGLLFLVLFFSVVGKIEEKPQKAQVEEVVEQKTNNQGQQENQEETSEKNDLEKQKELGEEEKEHKKQEEQKVEREQNESKEEIRSPEASVTINVVDYVVDGDTVELRSGERVRLIGINTPEIGQPYSSEAKKQLQELIEGKEVVLEKDVSDRDQYGRLLRYIWIGDTFINLKMVELGYANSYSYPPDVKYQEQIRTKEKEAREKQIGLWEPAEASNCIIVSYMHADADGNDNYNLNNEYVIFKNTCSETFNMASWTIKDEATHIFDFPSFYFPSQATITLYSGSGSNTTDKLYWNREDERFAIWNNSGDTVFLRDEEGELVLEYGY